MPKLYSMPMSENQSRIFYLQVRFSKDSSVDAIVNYMIVRVTADTSQGIKEVAVNYNSLSKPFLKIFKREIDGVNPVVISQLNETL